MQRTLRLQQWRKQDLSPNYKMDRQEKTGTDIVTSDEIETEMGRDLDSGAPGVRTRSSLAEKDDKEKVWVDAMDSDNRKREQAVEHEQNWRNLETLETRLSRTSSGGDSTTELNILRRLSASENNWRLKDIPHESANWRSSLQLERPQTSESGWQTTEGTESWRSNNVGRHLDNSTSWRTINDISKTGTGSSLTDENWRQNQEVLRQNQDNWKFNQESVRHLQDGLRLNQDNWRRNHDGMRPNGPELWRQENWKLNGTERANNVNMMFGGINVDGGTGNSWNSGGGGAAWHNPHTVDGGAWKRNLEENSRLSNDLFRLKNPYLREDCGSRDGASALSRESSRDDINSISDQQFDFEERFKVDRRKLELMMMGSGESDFGEAAAAFFERIGAETDTVVIWPSRLKIGAKSKKDPHIRVGGGQEDGVKAAKARITEVLDTRVNSRVTMKMDVSYTDHSHIIGKGGNTIRRVMSDTNCHIHFPDSNRSNPNEKSNQVSIAGEMAGVERARARVRELTPLIFQFDLAIVPSFHSIPDPNNQYLRAIQDQYNIQISFRQKQKNFHTTTVVIKGCELEASRVKEATLLLMDQLSPNNPASVSVNMTMEISPGHHNVVVGKESINLRVIMQRTNTTIIFPDAGDPNIPPIRKGSVTISGAIHNVYLARQLLLGSLPIVMMFDLPENIEIHESMVQKLQEANEVTITIKPKARQTNKSVIIKSQERNVGGMYVARHKLLDLEGEEVKADVPETYKVPLVGSSSMFHLASLPANRGPFLCPTPQLQALSSPLSPNFIHPSCYTPVTPNFPPVSPWQFPTNNLPPVIPDMGKVAPTFPSLQEYMMIMGLKQQQQQQQQLHHQQQLLQQQMLEKEQLELEKKQRSAWTSPPQRSNRMGPSSSDLGSSMHSSPIHSPRNSSPVNPGGNLTNNLHKMELTSSSSSGIVTDHNVSDLSAIMADFPDLSCTDRRAPGCEKKVAEIADYEHARIIAHQAIQQKPGGEERKPNPSWAGFGFSASFPDAVLRERRQTETRLRQRTDVSHIEWIHNMAQIKEGEDIDLEQLLLSQGLSKYSDIFLRHEIDLKMFSYLTEDELKEIGINAFGPRKKLLMLGEKIRGKTLTVN